MDPRNSDQSTVDIDIYPETRAKCAQARRLSASVPILSSHAPDLPTFTTIGTVLAANTRAFSDKNWLTFYDETGIAGTYSYAEFFATVMRFAAWLQTTLNVRQGDRVATLMVNDPRAILTYFAAWTLGVTIVPLNPTEDQERIRYILQDAAVRVVFVFEEQSDRWNSLLGTLDANTTDDNELKTNLTLMGLPSFLCSADSEAAQAFFLTASLSELPDLDSSAECLIVYTSGTTGPPKGVVLEQSNLLADGHSIAQWMQFGPADRAMNVLPLHHVNGIMVTLITPLYVGASVVINRQYQSSTFWTRIAREQVHIVSVVPTLLQFSCEHADAQEAAGLAIWGDGLTPADQLHLTRHFRHIICGAGTLAIALAKRFEDRFHIPILHGYGLSETTCYSCFLPSDLDWPTHQQWLQDHGYPSIGCQIAPNEMAIFDASGSGQPLGASERGEICVRGHNVMKYYDQRPDANRETFKFGWFRTGDEGFYEIDPQGRQFFFISGRLKELINRGGVKFSPFDIEEVLLQLAGVKVGLAIGFENDYYGEEVGAYIVSEDGATLTAEQVLAHCRAHMSFEKSPKVAIFGTEIPVTTTGKYQRLKLRDQFAPWKVTQFRK